MSSGSIDLFLLPVLRIGSAWEGMQSLLCWNPTSACLAARKGAGLMQMAARKKPLAVPMRLLRNSTFRLDPWKPFRAKSGTGLLVGSPHTSVSTFCPVATNWRPAVIIILSQYIYKCHISRSMKIAVSYARSLGSCQSSLKKVQCCASQGYSEDQRCLDTEYCSCMGQSGIHLCIHIWLN